MVYSQADILAVKKDMIASNQEYEIYYNALVKIFNKINGELTEDKKGYKEKNLHNIVEINNKKYEVGIINAHFNRGEIVADLYIHVIYKNKFVWGKKDISLSNNYTEFISQIGEKSELSLMNKLALENQEKLDNLLEPIFHKYIDIIAVVNNSLGLD